MSAVIFENGHIAQNLEKDTHSHIHIHTITNIIKCHIVIYYYIGLKKLCARPETENRSLTFIQYCKYIYMHGKNKTISVLDSTHPNVSSKILSQHNISPSFCTSLLFPSRSIALYLSKNIGCLNRMHRKKIKH